MVLNIFEKGSHMCGSLFLCQNAVLYCEFTFEWDAGESRMDAFPGGKVDEGVALVDCLVEGVEVVAPICFHDVYIWKDFEDIRSQLVVFLADTLGHHEQGQSSQVGQAKAVFFCQGMLVGQGNAQAISSQRDGINQAVSGCLIKGSNHDITTMTQGFIFSIAGTEIARQSG